MRSAFLRWPWRGPTQYITRPAAHARSNGGSTPTGVTAGPPRTNGPTDALRVSKESAVVRMTNLCDGISKRFRRSVLHRPATWFRLRLQQIPSPLVPPSTAFSLVRFYPKLCGSLPKSQLRLTTRFCPTSPTVEATHCSAVHCIMAQH